MNAASAEASSWWTNLPQTRSSLPHLDKCGAAECGGAALAVAAPHPLMGCGVRRGTVAAKALRCGTVRFVRVSRR